ncbi:MAG: CHAT domain-containing protein [Muribaculaceae bacterium]|nr:CHAT domain-containing protein [Muribaculaceae bacterium]
MNQLRHFLTFIILIAGILMSARGYGKVISTSDLPEIDDDKMLRIYYEASLKKGNIASGMDDMNELEELYYPLMCGYIYRIMHGDSILTNPDVYPKLVMVKDLCEKMMENIDYIDHPGVRYFRLKNLGLRPAHLYLAEAYADIGMYNQADSVYLLVVRNMREDFGVDSEEYIDWSLKISDKLNRHGTNFSLALKVMEPGIKTVMEDSTISPDLSFRYLLSLSEKSERTGKHKDALKYAEKALDLAREKDQIYNAHLAYGRLLVYDGRLDEASKYLLSAAKNCDDLKELIYASYSYVNLLLESGYTEEAVNLMDDIGNRYLNDPALTELDRFIYYETLGVSLTHTDISRAREAFAKAEEYINVVPRDAVLRHMLNSQVYACEDNSFKVISALDRAAFLYSTFIKDDPRMLTELLYLNGYYYNRINDYDTALRFLAKALENAMNLGESDPLLIRICNEIAESCKKNQNYDLRRDAIEALLRVSSNLPPDSRQRLDALSEAIDFYLDFKDVSNTRKYLGEYFNIRPNGVNTQIYAIRLGILTGEYENARILIDHLEKLGDQQRIEADKLRETLYADWGKSETALYARKNLENYRKELTSRLLWMNSSERRNLSSELEARRDNAIRLADTIPGMAEVALDYSLMIKGLLFTTAKNVQKKLMGIPEAKADMDTLNKLRLRLNLAESKGNAEECKRLRDQIASRERYIISDFVDFSEFEDQLKKQSLNSILTNLPEEAALVDLVGIREGRYFVAFVVDGKTKKVHFVKLASKHKLKRIPSGIWMLLDSLLQGKKDVYFSTDRSLSSLPLEYMTDENGKPYSDRYRLHRVFHPADIHSNILPGKEMVAIGVSDHNSPIGKGETIDRGSWVDLPGVKDELKVIRRRMGTDHLKLIFNDKARETEVKKLDGSKMNILHISTHGFHRDRDELIRAIDSIGHPDYEMALRAVAVDKNDISGLVLRNGNMSWKSSVISDAEDDLLTDGEIELLSFPNLDLTVLSACDTGLAITDSEGVWGLQRAFRIAGTKNLICTLSKVNDYWTVQFMDIFYENLAKGETIYSAFHQAQQWLRKEVPDNPEIWSAFILIE